jgi:hypothetical protein
MVMFAVRSVPLTRNGNAVEALPREAVKPDKLADYPMPPADEPLVAWLRDLL